MVNQFVYQVIECKQLSEFISLIELQAVISPMIYEAGQYIKVVHPDGNLSPLSIACAPSDPNKIELHLSHAPGNVKAQEILKMIKEEERLILQGPFGSCTIKRFLPNKKIILVAAGTGFAPAKALIEAMSEQNHYPAIHLYRVASTISELYLSQLAEQWTEIFPHFTYTYVLGRRTDNEPDRIYKLEDSVLRDFPDLSDCQIYASGSQKMVLDMLNYFEQFGMTADRFYSDIFDYS